MASIISPPIPRERHTGSVKRLKFGDDMVVLQKKKKLSQRPMVGFQVTTFQLFGASNLTSLSYSTLI